MALGYGMLKNVIPQKANDLNLTFGGLYLHNLGRYCKLVVVVDLIIRSHLSFFFITRKTWEGKVKC
jgi:hypothetical protein